MSPSFPTDDILNYATNLATIAKTNPALHNALDSIRTKAPEALAAAKNDPTLNNALTSIRTKAPQAFAAAKNDPALNQALEALRTSSADVLAAAKNDPHFQKAIEVIRTKSSDILAAAKADPTITNAMATLRTRTPQYLSAIQQNPHFRGAVEAVRIYGGNALAVLGRPEVQKVLIAGGLAAGGAALVVHLAGFGGLGIVGGSPAAAIQSLAYGGFTPGGSAFSGLTAMGMKGEIESLMVGTAIGVGILTAVGKAAFELEKSKL